MGERSPLAHFGVLVGVTLVLAGVALTVAQVVGVRLVGVAWPVLVIVPGVLLLLAALSVPPGRGGTYLAVPGTVVIVTGVVLLAQAASGDWQSWAYAWALVAPASVGLGLLIAGIREKARGARIAGGSLLAAGAVIFVVAEWFFVRVLGVGGPGLGWGFGLALPTLLVAFGLVVLVRGLASRRA